MKLILDTHAFIWWVSEPKKLSEKVVTKCKDQENILIVSVDSV